VEDLLAKNSVAMMGKQVPFDKLRAGSHRAFRPVRNDIGFCFRPWFFLVLVFKFGFQVWFPSLGFRLND
jgi:hypothetical protein